eukprot:CAMPEP_0184694096 /NCGR_PEP_ID=MMETSP0313-20130426/2150_1 /TAXON_ID=2792 /ORGANISM="Porphyridium aerugineum, Strain SAG 1380-2" /LENGTH=419 /DNA_ID=CAMNT_0027152321 /DNA_START=67 /DNA_END=1326 /DNA_ORIENTATION=-
MGWFTSKPNPQTGDQSSADPSISSTGNANTTAANPPPPSSTQSQSTSNRPVGFERNFSLSGMDAETKIRGLGDAIRRLPEHMEVSSEDIPPIIGQLSVGSLAGYATGYALKRIGKVAAFGLGTVFVVLQGLSYSGLVYINWRKLERDYIDVFDQDKDGVVTTKDAEIMADKLAHLLKYNIPSGVGFTAGMFFGIGSAAGTAAKAALGYGLLSRLLLSRVALAGAGGAATVGIPAVILDVREMLGLKRVDELSIEKEEIFWETLKAIDDKKVLKSMRDATELEVKRLEKRKELQIQILDEKSRILSDIFSNQPLQYGGSALATVGQKQDAAAVAAVAAAVAAATNGNDKAATEEQDDASLGKIVWTFSDRAAVENLQHSIGKHKQIFLTQNEHELAEVKKKFDAVDARLKELKKQSWWPW